MPSSKGQKAKTRKSRELDFENLDVILGNNNINPIERELSNVTGNSENHCDTESNHISEKRTFKEMGLDITSMTT